MVVPAGFPSFPCPSCGGALPATMAAGMVIPCPLCQQQITVPLGGGPSLAQADAYQSWAMQHGNTAAALADAQAATAANRLFASTSPPVLVEDGDGRWLLVGAQVSQQHGWWLRALDLGTLQLRWESMAGTHFQTCPSWSSLCSRNGRIYINHDGSLTALDAGGGQVLWQHPLGGRVARHTDRGPLHGDEIEIDEVAGVTVLRTESEVLWGLDSQSGAVRWRRRCERRVRVYGGMILIEENVGTVELLRPSDGGTVASFAAGKWRHGALIASGLVVGAEEYGDDEQEGVVLVDPSSGQVRWFAQVGDLDLDIPPVELDGQIFLALQTDGVALVKLAATGAPVQKKGFFARLFGGGGKGPAPQRLAGWDGWHLEKMWAVGGALAIEACGDGGVRRIGVIDPATLTVRHDSGAQPYGSTPGVRIHGSLVVYSVAKSNGPHTVRAVESSTGAVLWTRELVDLDELAFRGGHVALVCGGWTQAVEPTTGKPVASYQQ